MFQLSAVIQGLLGIAFVVRGAIDLFGTERARARFAVRRRASLVRVAIGGAELVAGIGMGAAIAQPFLVFFVAVFSVLTLVGRLLVVGRVAFRQERVMVTLFFVGAVVAAALQPLGLRVLALPKPDALPVEPVASARVVQTYEPGLWFESVKVGPDGTVYLAGNRGENYATGDKSQVHARVIARRSDGTERVFFELPQGATAGVIAFGADGQMYMTGQGAALGVWRLSPDGRGTLFATLPDGAWPNGMTVGPDGLLYVADSLMGVIWRIDPVSGAVSRAIENDALRRRPLIALAPGANGIHFFGRDLYVTVSDRAQVLKFELAADGRLSAPSVFARGIPGDDFAIDAQGTLYITTHPFNTIVRVTQRGERTIVADARHGIVGATDAAFGVLPGDEDTLYVATDGGAFSGDAAARGTLVAVKIARPR